MVRLAALAVAIAMIATGCSREPERVADVQTQIETALAAGDWASARRILDSLPDARSDSADEARLRTSWMLRVGRAPEALWLLEESTKHSRTRDLPAVVRSADIVVAAVGRPRFVKADWIKPGAVIVDAGFHPEKCGDVNFDAAAQHSSAYTPIPGGVGPMTISMLIQQTVRAAELAAGIE